MPNTGDLVVLQSRASYAQSQLFEADAAAAIVGELAVAHRVHRVRRVDVRVEDSKAVLQVVYYLHAFERVAGKVYLQSCKEKSVKLIYLMKFEPY